MNKAYIFYSLQEGQALLNKKIIVVLLIGLLVLLAVGCAKGNDDNLKEEPNKKTSEDKKEEEKEKLLTVKDVYPLQQGNYWKYAGEGNEYAAFEQKVLFVEGNKAQLQVANGGTVMAMIYEYQDGKLVVVNSEEEFYEEENILDRENEMSQVILKEPFTVGTTWESADRKYTIEAIDAIVETPAGKFTNCIKIINTDQENSSKSYVYYKPGIGLIKQEFIGQDFKVVAELEKYDVKTSK